ncbi:ORC1-type DNA replication protein [Candidatus Woesearchaeota archaeon]|nr:ORC1-type DNA replication protein [Candidatus Woesearchaeota archaeon]
MSDKENQHDLGEFFESYLNRASLFTEKQVLQSTYIPPEIPHRDGEIKQIANILAPALRLERPSNIFVYGKTGTGKTVSVRYVLENLMKTAKEKKIPVSTIYVNCKLKKIADTEYRLIAHLARECGKQIPPTGLPTDEIYKTFFSALDENGRLLILVLDEIDQLVKKTGDGLLYTLSRVNEELKNAKVAIAGISNDLTFIEHLDPRVKSSLSEEELLFPPYNALQIKDILDKRVKQAFRNGAVEDGVTAKCAAYAAMEHGDSRRALELLRVSGELAERNGQGKVTTKNVDEAEDKIDRDKIFEALATQPTQMQATLYSIIAISEQKNNSMIFTGEVYELYKDLCKKVGLRPLTQRRVSDMISELDMLGVINVRVISKGRYGRTREIKMAVPRATTERIHHALTASLGLRR